MEHIHWLQGKKASIDAKLDPTEIEQSSSAYKDLISAIEREVDFDPRDQLDETLDRIFFKFEHFILKLAYPDSGNHQEVYFLPADRGGILESHKFIADAWLAQIPNLGLGYFPALQPLPKVTVDFIRAMLMSGDRLRPFLRNPQLTETYSLESVAQFIEDELIEGRLQTNTSTESRYPVFEYLPSHAKRSLKLDLASSMVSELAPIIVIARFHLTPFDFLIIEEPEAHLHPGALPLIAKCLAKLVRNNVRVLISTHSDWLLKSLRNLILEGDLVQLDSNQTSTDDDYLLRREVGAWEFSAGGDSEGIMVSKIEFDELDGIEPSEIERISDDLYNESVAIRNARARRQR